MKDHHKDKAHPTPKDGGMPYFEREHWEKKMENISVADGHYSSEMNQAEEYKRQTDALAAYAKKHKMEY